jgi:hypothetical protein
MGGFSELELRSYIEQLHRMQGSLDPTSDGGG